MINGVQMPRRNHIRIAPMGVDDNHIFNRISLKRPSVVRRGDKVMECHYWNGMHQCLGPQCFWPKVGVCPIFNKLKIKFKAK